MSERCVSPCGQRILFVCEAVTLAHVVRCVRLIGPALKMFNEVHFAAATSFDHLLPSLPVRRHLIKSRSPAQFSQDLVSGKCLFPLELLRSQVEEELHLIRRIKPSLIVSDLRPSLAVSAKLCGVPLITLTNGYWSPYQMEPYFPLPHLSFLGSVPTSWLRERSFHALSILYKKLLSRVLQEQGKGFEQLRKLHQLPAADNYLSLFTDGDYTAYADIPGLFSLERLPTNHRFLGHISWSPQVSNPAWITDLPHERALVFISLGSSGNDDHLELLVAELLRFNCTVVVALAGRAPLRARKGLFQADYLCGETLARQATFVVTNGGSPSSYQALSAGKPVLGISQNMDQLMCMHRICEAKAGIMLRSDLLSRRRLRQALSSLFEQRDYRARAESLAVQFHGLTFDTEFTGWVRNIFDSGESKTFNPHYATASPP